MKGKWRRPHGLQSKIREKRKGHINPPSTGYGSPRAVYGLDMAGRAPLVVSNAQELQKATKEHVVIIARSVGMKKRVALVEAAIKKGLVLSIKNPSAFIAAVNEQMKQRHEARRMTLADKEKRKKEDEQKAKQKAAEKTEEEQKSDEERKEQEKKEIDKILTHTN